MPIAAALRQAVSHHKSGNLEEALRIYRRVLDVQPQNVNALNLGGIALFRLGHLEAARIDLLGSVASTRDHLASYSNVDIALDTFPYNGTTTTCETLWMGVPVVALLGDRHAGRVSASLLTTVGLPELVAESEDDYVEKAVGLAGDPRRRSELRAGLRERMRSSPLCDAERFARNVENAYRNMWRRWCAQTASGR